MLTITYSSSLPIATFPHAPLLDNSSCLITPLLRSLDCLLQTPPICVPILPLNM